VTQNLVTLVDQQLLSTLLAGLAQEIHVVELPGYTVHHGIPEQEQRRLVQTVRAALGKGRR
jgi:hypothetical protein